MLRPSMRCSFCRRPDSQVAKLVAGPRGIAGRVYICDRCAVQTIAIMEGHSGDEPPRAETMSLFRRVVNRLSRWVQHTHQDCRAAVWQA